MSPITRHHVGTATIDAQLLDDLDWALDMDTAAPRDVIAPLAAHFDDYNRDLGRDDEINHTEGVHDWLTVLEVDAVQRLRGKYANPTGQITVDAEALSDVRNVLDQILLSGIQECEDYADGNDPIDGAAVRDALSRGERCYLCGSCKLVVLRDRIDLALDAQGFEQPAYYTPPDYDPDWTWLNRVIGKEPDEPSN